MRFTQLLGPKLSGCISSCLQSIAHYQRYMYAQHRSKLLSFACLLASWPRQPNVYSPPHHQNGTQLTISPNTSPHAPRDPPQTSK